MGAGDGWVPSYSVDSYLLAEEAVRAAAASARGDESDVINARHQARDAEGSSHVRPQDEDDRATVGDVTGSPGAQAGSWRNWTRKQAPAAPAAGDGCSAARDRF